jgi:DNA-binding NtrC family response regulator
MFKERLEALIDEMTERGIFYSEAVREFRKIFIGRVLEQNGGNQVRAAQKLGMHRNTLGRTLSELQIELPGSVRKRPAIGVSSRPVLTKKRQSG